MEIMPARANCSPSDENMIPTPSSAGGARPLVALPRIPKKLEHAADDAKSSTLAEVPHMEAVPRDSAGGGGDDTSTPRDAGGRGASRLRKGIANGRS
jgi:hypothetical protein